VKLALAIRGGQNGRGGREGAGRDQTLPTRTPIQKLLRTALGREERRGEGVGLKCPEFYLSPPGNPTWRPGWVTVSNPLAQIRIILCSLQTVGFIGSPDLRHTTMSVVRTTNRRHGYTSQCVAARHEPDASDLESSVPTTGLLVSCAVTDASSTHRLRWAL
jgi:hypothetical protein